jgi:hypothetical protein
MSSTIWNSTPSSSAKRRYGILSLSGTSLSSNTTPMLAAISRPVFSACICRRASGSGGGPCRARSGSRTSKVVMSTYWPPTIPPSPVALTSSPSAASTRAGSPSWREQNRCIASANKASPARIAMSSPNLTCEVGIPRRSSSSSIAGRSSWISE